MNPELAVETALSSNAIIGELNTNQNEKNASSIGHVEQPQLNDNQVTLVVADVQQHKSSNTTVSDPNDSPSVLTSSNKTPDDVEMTSHDMQNNIQNNSVYKSESDLTSQKSPLVSNISAACLNGQQNENIDLETSVVVDTNNNYTPANLNDYSTHLSPKHAVNEKLPTDLEPTDLYLPSTTTVNLSESNQSVYFMMQTATTIDLLSNQPVSSTAASSQSNNMTGLNNSTSNGPVKLKSSPTSTPTVTKKLYSPKHLDGSQLMANSTGSSMMILNSPNISASSSPLNVSPNGTNKIVRDERRRANHNEVERRRRDNINKWIVELSKVIPDCSNDQSKHGQSKGGILEKTVQYLSDIKKANQELHEHIRSIQMVKQENSVLREQNEMYRKDNEFLKRKLSNSTVLMESLEELQNSIELADSSGAKNQQQAMPTTSSISSSSSTTTTNCKRL